MNFFCWVAGDPPDRTKDFFIGEMYESIIPFIYIVR